jgi:cellobiose phosphorylase
MNKNTPGWQFIDDDNAFTLNNPHHTSNLYFPLVNEAGMVSVVTPTLHGDVKTGHNTFLTPPVSVEDLHNTRSARNFWVTIEDVLHWSATGNSAAQTTQRFSTDYQVETVQLKAGFLWHTVTRTHKPSGLQAEICNIVPPTDDKVELMRITLTNTGQQQPLDLNAPTAAIPLYARSADNLRDHRHVTSLLHRITTHQFGVTVCPTLSFDERGHQENSVTYAVLGCDGDGNAPSEFFPIVEDFIGEGGNLSWPEAIIQEKAGTVAGESINGYEALGGLRFPSITLQPGESKTYLLVLAILADGESSDSLIEKYGGAAQFQHWLEQTEQFWQKKLATFAVELADTQFNRWMKWTTVQPILRRLCGNSFLPYHDYGRGGRGWRDLWQDMLALLIMEPNSVREHLYNNFAGVRFDGSNATIIGAKPGEFKADRNNIPRVWMDHGAWPLLTTKLYIDQSGDWQFLLQDQQYFKDQFVYRAQKIDSDWKPEQGTTLKTATGEVVTGTILEHILVQHLTVFFHVGEHNTILLEGADWNDGMDMADQRGESVAFSGLYAGNLCDLSRLVLQLQDFGVEEVEIAEELSLLLDTLDAPVDYSNVTAKRQRLNDYFAVCERTLSGKKRRVTIGDLWKDFSSKANWLFNHIRENEWITNEEGYSWFNGYYDDDGQRVEGDHPNGVRMTLTGQAFALMGSTATDEQAQDIIRAADRYLYDETVHGYRLNTDFGDLMLNLGRCFGYAYGHKENGAMFSHMAVMYAYALYERGLVKEGHKVMDGIYEQSANFPVSRMYPGIPEYFTDKGRGLYPWLTGSASWYLLTLLTQVFGVRGDMGDLVFSPKLVAEQFSDGAESIVFTLFADRNLKVIYRNPGRLDYGAYTVTGLQINGEAMAFERSGDEVIVKRSVITALDAAQTHIVEVTLGAK